MGHYESSSAGFSRVRQFNVCQMTYNSIEALISFQLKCCVENCFENLVFAHEQEQNYSQGVVSDRTCLLPSF